MDNYNTLPGYMKGTYLFLKHCCLPYHSSLLCVESSRNVEEFTEKLNYLRDYSETFLRMLNDMRRRLKELRPDTQMAQNYRCF